MKLKEKFNNELDLDNDKYITYECEEIADEFAIGFGEYLDSLTAQDMGILSVKELLEIYKKELL